MLQARGSGRRLRRDRARHGRLLQPAAQRSRSVRRGLRHRHAAEQPVREVQGAVLAAGVHRPAEVRDPAATPHRRLHDVRRGLPLHPGRLADRPRHPPPEGIAGRPAGGRACCAMEEYRLLNVERTWSHWFEEDAGPHGAPVRRRAGDVPGRRRAFRTTCGRRRAPDGPRGGTSSRHSSAGTASGWSRLDTRLRSSITEGIVVFLSLFDDNPAVHRAFCPPRSAYLGTRRTRRATAARADRHAARRRPRARPQLPGRDEPRSGPHHRRDAEAGLPARGAAAHPEDERRAASGSGATCCSSATSTTPLPRSVRPTRPATSGPSRSRGRRA